MIHVQCPGCGTSAHVNCIPGCEQVEGAHLDKCPGADLDSLVQCGCCKQDHHHGAAANACAGRHAGDCGPGTDGCTVCRPLIITMLPGTTLQPAGG